MQNNAATQRVAEMIREGLSRSGKKKSPLARELGVSHATINYWVSGKTRPEVKRAASIAAALGLDEDDLIQAIRDTELEPARVSTKPLSSVGGTPNITPAKAIDLYGIGPSDIPVYGVVVGGSDGEFHLNGAVETYYKRPPAIANLMDVYALHVVGNSMAPRFRDGELVYVQSRTPHINDDVIVQLKPLDEGSPPRGFLKYLIRRNGSHIVCGQYQPEGEVIYERDDILSVHRVIPWKELLSA